MMSLFIAPSGIADVGHQLYHFVTGLLDVDLNKECDEHCFFQSVIGKGDHAGVSVTTTHAVAEEARDKRAAKKTKDEKR